MIKEKTGVQLNQGHTSTDEFITQKLGHLDYKILASAIILPSLT